MNESRSLSASVRNRDVRLGFIAGALLMTPSIRSLWQAVSYELRYGAPGAVCLRGVVGGSFVVGMEASENRSEFKQVGRPLAGGFPRGTLSPGGAADRSRGF